MNTARIVVLGIAVVAGGVAAMLAAGSDEPKQVASPTATPQIETTEVLVAGNEIGVGQVVNSGDMQWMTWPSATAGSFIRKSDQPNAMEQIAGSVARAAISPGEPIREARLIKANGSGFMAAILPGGMRAVSVEISPETGAGGFILPNDRVDVILSRRDRAAEKATGIETPISETVLTNVKVLAIDQNIEEKNGQKVVVGKTATLELSGGQAEQIVLARQMGAIALALRSLSDASGKEQPAESSASDRRRTINIVRFGTSSPVPAR